MNLNSFLMSMFVIISFCILWIIFVSNELDLLKIKQVRIIIKKIFILYYFKSLSGENVVSGTIVIVKNNSSTGFMSASL